MPRVTPRLNVRPVDLGGEIELDIPAGWICRPLEPGRWWCGEAEPQGAGVFLRQELTDPRRSEPGRAPTPLANAEFRADQIRVALGKLHPGAAVSDRPTMSGRVLQIGGAPPRRALSRPGEVRWAAVEGYSTAVGVLHVTLNLPRQMAGGAAAAEQLVAHFAAQAALGSRCPPRAAGSLRLRELRIGDAAVLGVPAEWRCRHDDAAIRCSIDDGAALLIRWHAWPKAELLGELDPPPPPSLPRNALAALVVAHLRGSLPDRFEAAPVEMAAHGAILAMRDPLPAAAGPVEGDTLSWIYALIDDARIVGIWLTLSPPPGGGDDPAAASLADRVADCIRRLRPAGAA